MNILDFRTENSEQKLEKKRAAAEKLYHLIPGELRALYVLYSTRQEIEEIKKICSISSGASEECADFRELVKKLALQKNWKTMIAVQKAENRRELARVLDSARLRAIIEKPKRLGGMNDIDSVDYLSLIAFLLSDETVVLNIADMKKLTIEILGNFSLTKEQK